MTDFGDDSTLPAAAERLRQLNRLTTTARMVASLAHELNNSMQVVGGLVELLADRTDIPADAATRLEKIGGQTDKATSAIRQVLTYTREVAAESGQVSLGAVAERALVMRRYQLGRGGIATHLDLPPAPVIVMADERHVLQMVLNLVLNVEDALMNQPQRDLRLAVVREGGRAQVHVSDTGPGVSDDVKARIFDPFFTTRTGERTLGLGLPVARELAAQYGGDVTLRDGRPGMTTFVIDLPIR